MRQSTANPYRLERFNAWYRVPETLAAFGSLGLLAIETGFDPGAVLSPDVVLVLEILLLGLLFLRIPASYVFSSTLKTGFGRAGADTIWLGIVLVLLVIGKTAGAPSPAALVRIALLGFGVLRMFGGLRAVQRVAVSPLMLFVMSYAAIIFAGAALLMMPRAVMPGVVMTPVNALFMSASAACVTGLSLYDIGTQFSAFGQMVLLVLMQIGGLGIMTFAAFVATAFGSGMSLRDRVAMGEVLNYDVVGRIGRLVQWILLLTLVAEGLGAAVMYGHWRDNAGAPLPAGEQLYSSIYHSISAFCNAGFSLHGSSLVQYDGYVPVMLPMAMLIIIGGLGFAVVMDIGQYRFWHQPAARRLPWIGKHLRRGVLPRLSLQTKLVLWTTAGLIVLGTGVFWLLEHEGVLAGQEWDRQLLGSFFQGGVTPRTAGFNSLDYSAMKSSTQFFMILLMMIGASPGSTAGGLKTVSVAILFLAVWKTMRGRPVEIFKRRIVDEQVRRVLVILVIALVVVNGAVFCLTLTEPWVDKLPRGFEVLTFEVVSAFGTVGLSIGGTGELTEAGRVIIAICMFLGRIGPLTLVLSLGARRPAAFDYPNESVMLG